MVFPVPAPPRRLPRRGCHDLSVYARSHGNATGRSREPLPATDRRQARLPPYLHTPRSPAAFQAGTSVLARLPPARPGRRRPGQATLVFALLLTFGQP
jgi:hypothetical protein